MPNPLDGGTGEVTTSLKRKAWLSLAALVAVMSLMLFVPAGTLRYWQAWAYLILFTGTSALITLELMRRDPALLERRMRGGPTAEKRPVQRLIQLFTSMGFITLLVVPALDFHFGWSAVPAAGVVIGDALVLTGLLLVSRVYRENTFTSATVEVSADQRIISTGPYALVRHPMYASASLYLVGTPLALGSYRGLLVVAAMLPFLVWRLLDEEHFLATNLAGYPEYQRRVRYRLVPFVW